jgi:8-oxo-dGTP diphosphatase
VDVVAAALIRDGRVLAARRVTPPGWEFPGGKVEAGETPQQALVRECREELAIEIECGARLAVTADDRITLQLWQAALLAGTPVARDDHDALRWIDRDELDGLDWLPLDRAMLAAVHSALS